MIIPYAHLSELASRYDAFLVDLWGVIHDGTETYAGATECLKELREHGKKIILISNAPRRGLKAKQVLDRLEVSSDLYDHIITSGEIVFDLFATGKHSYGSSYYILGPDRDDDLLATLPEYNHVTDIAQAQIVIVTGFDHDASTLDDVMPELHQMLSFNLPMICANPDIEVVRKTGERALCAGAIAKAYESMGGNTSYFGKPYPDVYQKALLFLTDLPKERIAAIGDNLETDILGANRQNIDSYLVAGGILATELDITHGELPSPQKLQALCTEFGITPTGALPAFVW